MKRHFRSLFFALFFFLLLLGLGASASGKPKPNVQSSNTQKVAKLEKEVKALKKQLARVFQVVLRKDKKQTPKALDVKKWSDLLQHLRKKVCQNRTGFWDKKQRRCLSALKLSSQTMAYDSIDQKNTCGKGWHIAGTHEAIVRYYLDTASRDLIRRRIWVWTIGNGAKLAHLRHQFHGSSLDYTHNSHPNSGYKATACQSGRWPVVYFAGLGRNYKPMTECKLARTKLHVLCARDLD